MGGGCLGAGKRGRAGCESEKDVQRSCTDEHVSSRREQVHQGGAVEDWAEADLFSHSRKGPGEAKPLADHAGPGRSGNAHHGEGPHAEDHQWVEDDVEGVDPRRDVQRCPHVLDASQDAKGGETHQHGGGSKQPNAHVVYCRRLQLSGGAHQLGDRVEKGQQGRHDDAQQAGHEKRRRAALLQEIPVTFAFGAGGEGLNSDADEIQDPEGAREDGRGDSQRGHGRGA